MEQLIYTILADPDNEETGIDAIAFTEDPAILIKGMAFKNQTKKHLFKDDVKMRIVAPAMVPSVIYRLDEKDGEYYVEFTAAEIEKLFVKFMRSLNNSKENFNLEHNPDYKVPSFILEAWIVDDPKTDKAYTSYNIEVPKGSLMLTTQITDPAYYQELVSNGQIGYSIEGLFDMSLKFSKEKSNINKTQMKKSTSKTARLKAFSARLRASDIDTSKGGYTLIAEDLEPGKKASLLTPELELIEDWTGEIVIDDTLVIVESGVISDVSKAEEIEEEMASEEEIAEEEIEEEMASEEDEEKEPKEQAYQLVPEEVLSIVQPKLDEIYGVIADLKNQIESQISTEPSEEEKPVSLSVHDRFASVLNFLKK